MNIEATLNKLKEVQEELEQLRQFAALLHDNNPKRRGKSKGARKPMSAETKKLISVARKAAWDKKRKAK